MVVVGGSGRCALKYMYGGCHMDCSHIFSIPNTSHQPIIRYKSTKQLYVLPTWRRYSSEGDRICRSILILSCISYLTHHHVVFNNTGLFPQQARTTPPLIDFAQVNTRSDTELQWAGIYSVNLPLPAFPSHFWNHVFHNSSATPHMNSAVHSSLWH